jgi:hypothetical protein
VRPRNSSWRRRDFLGNSYLPALRDGLIKVKESKWARSTDSWAVLGLFFCSILFFYDLLPGRYLLAERDLGPYFIPPRFFWVETIKKGDFPLWNPYQFSGHPFFANPQQAILYPLDALFFLLPFDWAFNAIIILHFFLGGVFTYFFLRDLKVNSTGALISGLIFMLSGYLLSVHSLLSTLLSSIWTPLIMMFFRRALLDGGLKNEIWVAIFMTLSFLGGGLEIVYGNFGVLFLMIFFSPPRSSPEFPKEGQEKSRGGRVWFGLRSILIIAGLSFLLSAVQLLPFLELFHHSIRGQGISYGEATIWSFAPKDFLLFLIPDAYGYFFDIKKYWASQCWLKTLYTGGLPFVLGSFYFLRGTGRIFYLSLMLVSLLLSLGNHTPLYRFLYEYIPFLNTIRYPVKFLYFFILGLAIISGLGWQKLMEFSAEPRNKRLVKILLGFSFFTGFALLFFVLGHSQIEYFLRSKGMDVPDFNPLAVNLHHAKRFLLLVVGQELKWKRWAKFLLILFLAADLFGNMGFYGKDKTEEYLKKTRILDIVSSDTQGPFRTFTTAKTIAAETPILIGGASYLATLKEKHLPSMNLLYPLADIWGIDVITLKRVSDLYKAFTGAPSISATNLIDLYGVKYIISVTPLEEDPRLELIYARLEGLQETREELLKRNTVKLYRNRNLAPRAWLVKDFQVLDAQAVLGALVTKGFHPAKSVLLEEEPIWLTESVPQGRAREGGSTPENKVEFVSESNNRLRLRVQAAEKSLLVLSDTYFPGWKAFVNGKETKIYRANYAFRALPLKAGTHEVEFVYDPIWFRLGAGLTFWGIIACLVIGWFPRKNISSPK